MRMIFAAKNQTRSECTYSIVLYITLYLGDADYDHGQVGFCSLLSFKGPSTWKLEYMFFCVVRLVSSHRENGGMASTAAFTFAFQF